jgi:hypothetical protein
VGRPRAQLAAPLAIADLGGKLEQVTDVMLRRAEERYVNAELLYFVHGCHSALFEVAGVRPPSGKPHPAAVTKRLWSQSKLETSSVPILSSFRYSSCAAADRHTKNGREIECPHLAGWPGL